jgi:ferrous iron transport protein B
MTQIFAAIKSIPTNIANLSHAFSNPILASMPEATVNHGVYGEMYSRFAGQAGAFAYLLFVLLYIPCISTVAAMARELGPRWTIFSVFWNTSLAYCVAVLFFQIATYAQHPFNSLVWILVIISFFALVFIIMRRYADKLKPKLSQPFRAIANDSC